MKKTIYSILFVASVLASSSCMKVDNFDAPEAHVTGRIIDSTTGEIFWQTRANAESVSGRKVSA